MTVDSSESPVSKPRRSARENAAAVAYAAAFGAVLYCSGEASLAASSSNAAMSQVVSGGEAAPNSLALDRQSDANAWTLGLGLSFGLVLNTAMAGKRATDARMGI